MRVAVKVEKWVSKSVDRSVRTDRLGTGANWIVWDLTI